MIIASCYDCNNDSARIQLSISQDGGASYSVPTDVYIKFPLEINYEVKGVDGTWGLSSLIQSSEIILKFKILNSSTIKLNSIQVLYSPGDSSISFDYDTIVLKVSKSSDDARNALNGTSYNHNVFTQYIGKYYLVEYNHGLRFENLPFDSSIVFEKILLDLFYAGIFEGDTVYAKIYYEDNLSPPTFSNQYKPFHRLKSSSYKEVKIHSLPEFENGFGYLVFDLTSIISEFINNNLCNQGNNLVILIESINNTNNTYVGFSTYDRSVDRGAELSFIIPMQNNSKRTKLVQNILIKGSINIYPNPSSSIINVDYNNLPLKLYFYDILENLVHSCFLSSGDNQINIEFLKKGIYLIKAEDANNISVFKFI